MTMHSFVLNEQEIMKRLIQGDLVITPIIDPKRQLGPTSLDIRLGFDFKIFNIIKHTHLDPLSSENESKQILREYVTNVHISPMERFILHPGEFALASTLEYFRIPSDLAARLEGRSTWGRLGLQVHSTAGFVDPGFEGILTFELQNMGKGPLCLYPGSRIAQVCFFQTSETAVPYTKKEGAKYFHMMGAHGSLFYQDPEFKAIRSYKRKSAPPQICAEKEDVSKESSRFRTYLAGKLSSSVSASELPRIIDAVASSVYIQEPLQHRHIVAVDSADGSAKSKKSNNALLDWPRLFKALGGIVTAGYGVYRYPLILIPILVARMLVEGRELVTVKLDQSHSCVLLAINELSRRQGDRFSKAAILERAKMIWKNIPHSNDEVRRFSGALGDLVKYKSIVKHDDGMYSLRETVEIQS